jgi:hypothetical protein
MIYFIDDNSPKGIHIWSVHVIIVHMDRWFTFTSIDDNSPKGIHIWSGHIWTIMTWTLQMWIPNVNPFGGIIIYGQSWHGHFKCECTVGIYQLDWLKTFEWYIWKLCPFTQKGFTFGIHIWSVHVIIVHRDRWFTFTWIDDNSPKGIHIWSGHIIIFHRWFTFTWIVRW